MNKDLQVSGLNIFPIKSTRGISVNEAFIGSTGFMNDRRWMITDLEGHFITQRTLHQLALVETSLEEGNIKISAPNMEAYVFAASPTDGTKVEVEVWGDVCEAIIPDETLNQWMSEFLGKDCQLVYMPTSSKRIADEKYNPSNQSVSFADGFPYLLISEASLKDLNSRLETPIGMNRFRPNIEVSGGTPFQEDGWKKIKIGEAIFSVAKPCARCVLTTVNPETGEKGKEPLKTLAGYRNVNNKILFGQNLLCEEGEKISVGDKVEILE